MFGLKEQAVEEAYFRLESQSAAKEEILCFDTYTHNVILSLSSDSTQPTVDPGRDYEDVRHARM